MTEAGGALLRTLAGQTGQVECVAISPDGRIAAPGSWDGTIRIRELESGREAHEFGVSSLALTPDGRMAVSASKDGRAVAALNLDDSLHSCAVGPDGLP